MAATEAPLTGDVRYQETESLLQDVVALFGEGKHDVAAVRESGRGLADLHAAAQQRHAEMLQSIKELSGQVQRAKQDHLEQQSTLLDPTQKQQLLAERSRVDENIRRLVLETDGLRQRIGVAEGKAAELSAQEQQVRQQESVEVPRARHTISLYANISCIRWDYASPHIKGWATSPGGAGIKAFEMEPHRHTDFAVANYLWDLMDTCRA